MVDGTRFDPRAEIPPSSRGGCGIREELTDPVGNLVASRRGCKTGGLTPRCSPVRVFMPIIPPVPFLRLLLAPRVPRSLPLPALSGPITPAIAVRVIAMATFYLLPPRACLEQAVS